MLKIILFASFIPQLLILFHYFLQVLLIPFNTHLCYFSKNNYFIIENPITIFIAILLPLNTDYISSNVIILIVILQTKNESEEIPTPTRNLDP